MYRRFKKFILSLVFLLNITMPLLGQKDFNSRILPKIEKSEKEYLLRSNNEKKLESALYKIMKDAEASDTSLIRKEELSTTLKINKYLKADSKDRVSVLMELKTIRDVTPMVELIQSMDGTIEHTYKNFPYILCKIHPKKLRNLVSTISAVRISIPIQGHTRGIISAGDSQLKADSARIQFMVGGILHPKIVREVEGGEKMFDSEARSGA